MNFRNLKKMKFIIFSKVILLLFLSILVGNINSVQNDLKDRNKLSSNNSINLKFPSNDYGENLKILEELKSIDGLTLRYFNMDILETQTNEPGNIQGIYVNDDYFIDIPLKSGRLFTKEDMNSKERLAVIGENIEPYIEKRDGKQFILSGNDAFQVIGVFKSTKGYTNSDFIFYNLNSILNEPQKLSQSNWIVDSNVISQEELESIVHELCHKYNNEVRITPNKGLRYEPNSTSLFILSSMIAAFLLTAFTIIMSLIRSIIIWFNETHLELGVRRCCGGSKLNIFTLVSSRYVNGTILSFMISTISMYILTLCDINIIYFDFNLKIIVIALIIEVFIGLITILILFIKLKKLTISKLLKEIK